MTSKTQKTLVSIPLIIAANEKNFVDKLNKISEDEIRLEDIISDKETLSNLKKIASQSTKDQESLIIFEEIFKFEPQNTMLHDNPDEKIAEMQEIAVNLDQSSTTPSKFVALKEEEIAAIKKKIDCAFSNSSKEIQGAQNCKFQRASESFLPNKAIFQKTATGMKMMFDQYRISSDVRKFKKYLEITPFLIHGETYEHVLKIEPTTKGENLEKIITNSKNFFKDDNAGFFHSDQNDGILVSKRDGFLKTIQYTFLFHSSYNMYEEYRNNHRLNLVEFTNKMFIESYPDKKTSVKFNKELVNKIKNELSSKINKELANEINKKLYKFYSKISIKIPEVIEQLYNKFTNRNLVQAPQHKKTFIDEMFYKKCLKVEFDKDLSISDKFQEKKNQMRKFSGFRSSMYKGGFSLTIFLITITLIAVYSLRYFIIFKSLLAFMISYVTISTLLITTFLTWALQSHHLYHCEHKINTVKYFSYFNDDIIYAGSKVTEETIKSNQESQLKNNKETNNPQLQNNEAPIDPKLQNNKVPNDQLINDSNKEPPTPMTEQFNYTEILNITAESENLNIKTEKEETNIEAEKTQEIKADILPDSKINEAEYENVNQSDVKIKID